MGDLQTGERTPDAETMARIIETTEYQAWARGQLMELMDRTAMEEGGMLNRMFLLNGGMPAVREFGLEEIAARGSCPDFIGMAMLLQETRADPRDPCMGIHFTRLHRDPQWMGLNGWMPLLRGLRLEVHGAGGRPQMILAAPMDFPENPGAAGCLPAGETRELAGIAAWHGAGEITWLER